MSNCNSFPFFSLPYDLRLEVLSKLAVRDILNARLACSTMNELIERHRFSLPPRLFDEVELHPPCQETNGKGHMVYNEEQFVKLFKNGEIGGLTISFLKITSSFLASLERVVQRNRIRVQRLSLSQCQISIDASSFAHLVEVMDAFELSIVHSVAVEETFSSELAAHPTIRKLDRFGMLLPANVSDNYLLESRNEWLAVVGTNITTAAIKQFVEDWIECRRSFEYIALELPTEIDADDILADIECEYVEGNWSIRNKRGEIRTVGVCEKCIQIFSDDAMMIIEHNLQELI
ncbi:hypothetical protein V3C99_007432 [Haemonchus contortus]